MPPALVVTGLGAVTALGEGVGARDTGLAEGRSTTRRLTLFPHAGHADEIAALEAAALAAGLGARTALVTAPRAATGRFGAAGAPATAALAVAHDLVPPTLGHVPPARHGLSVVAGRAHTADVWVAVVDGVARGGACRPLRFEAP